jgi:septal ring factor EnvC (AmiA/AmiB activator)
MVYKLDADSMMQIHRELGATEATLSNIAKALEDVQKMIRELQKEVEQVKLGAAVTKTKIALYGALGSAGFTFAIYIVKTYLLKKGD